MEKVIFIGKTGSGKTTLCQKLHDLEVKYKKTQAVELYDNAIDTPGEYLENRHLFSALINTAVDAKIIALVADPTTHENYIPPAFTGTFAKEVIGIVTKMDLVQDENLFHRTCEQLKQAGVSKIFYVDTVQGTGIEELFDYLNQVLGIAQ